MGLDMYLRRRVYLGGHFGYWDDLKNTIEIIDKLDLTGEGYDEYYYRSSW